MRFIKYDGQENCWDKGWNIEFSPVNGLNELKNQIETKLNEVQEVIQLSPVDKTQIFRGCQEFYGIPFYNLTLVQDTTQPISWNGLSNDYTCSKKIRVYQETSGEYGNYRNIVMGKKVNGMDKFLFSLNEHQ